MSLGTLRTLALAAAAALAAPSASAQLMAYDGFGNGPLANLGGSTGGTGWASAWIDQGDNLTNVSGPGLAYAGLATAPGAAVTPVANGVWPNSVYRRSFPALPVGTNAIYVSFLMRADALWGIWGGVSFGTYPYEMTVGSPLGWYTYGLMLSEGLGDTAAKPLVVGETTLVVVRISKNTPAAGITYKMYLDPTIGSAEPSFPAVSYGVNPVSALPTFISIDNGTGFTTDEIRFGTTWESVLPAAPSPWTDLGFAKPGVNGAPHLAGVGPLTPGSANQLVLTHAKPSAVAMLVIGLSTVNLPFSGGTLVPAPALVVPLATNAAGSLSLTANWPAGSPSGLTLRLQYWIQDPAATFGLSASNGLGGVSQ